MAVNSVDFDIPRGSIVSLIGPNGAGKTTFFNMITGAYVPTSGEISFDGRDIVTTKGSKVRSLKPHQVTQLGIGRTFQNIRLFGTMSALDNVLVGEHVHLRSRWWDAVLRTPRNNVEEEASVARAHELLKFVGLDERPHAWARNLPYGDQRRLEIARALATSPKLLLLDEPTAGMNASETRDLTDFIRRLRSELGLTVLLIEHDMRVVMGISDRVTVLDYGEVLAEGSPAEVRANPTGRRGVPGPRRGRGSLTVAALLELKDVHTYYGAIHALRGVSFTVDEGEIVTLIGSNGAGKSTTLRTISGLLRPRQGEIWLRGDRIDSRKPHEIVALGVSQSPEGRRVFARMNIQENLEMGAFARKDRRALAAEYARVYELFPRLSERKLQKAGTLSGGEQQMLAIGRALMAAPKVLLLDEPSMGLAPILVEQIFEIIKTINAQGTTVLLVEQNALMALGIARRGYILQTGEVVLTDTADKLRTDPAVRKAYLGED